MPKDKTAAHQKILAAAKAEFLEKGFADTSMRAIAARVGMSAAGLYRHCTDKEELFAELVTPAIDMVTSWYQEHKEQDYDYLNRNELDVMWERGEDIHFILELVYSEFESFKLLICRSAGTRFENYLQSLASLELTETLAFMRSAKERGIPVNSINENDLRLFMGVYVEAMFGVVKNDYTLTEARRYFETFRKFFYPGWRAVLGL